MEKKKRVIVRVGDLYKIRLNDNEHSYAIKLKDERMAFFDFKTNEDISADNIISNEIIFILVVDSDAVKMGNWEKVGKNIDFSKSIELPNYFIWDEIGQKFKLYISQTGEIKPSTYNEIKDLEMAASWAYNHIEDRLRDYYSGKKCIWLEEDEEIKRNYQNL